MMETRVDVRANRPGPSWQDLLDQDSRPVPEMFRIEAPVLDDTSEVGADRYVSREYHELEKEHIWPRVWQFACREEHIPAPGDTYVYDIGDMSVLIVRGQDDVIRAFHNVCLHQGRRLRVRGGPSKEIRCSYHGFCWNHDGTNKSITCEWDFPHLDQDDLTLPPVHVGLWGGFVFVNMDDAAEPLEAYLGADFLEQFERWPLSERYVELHVAKVLRCNWKVANEAFMESMHVVTTHPQVLTSTADSCTQYDVYGNVSRAVSTHGVPSPHLPWEPTDDEIFRSMFNPNDESVASLNLPPGKAVRTHAADLLRERLRPVVGDAVDEYCDGDLNDHFFYTVFPNFHPWGAFNKIVYRFRPYGDDPGLCLMDVLLLAPFSGDRPPPAKVRWLDVDQEFLDAPELGLLARIFDQDAYNMPAVQLGLRQLKSLGRSVQFSVYQQTKVRHFHRLYDEWITGDRTRTQATGASHGAGSAQ